MNKPFPGLYDEANAGGGGQGGGAASGGSQGVGNGQGGASGTPPANNGGGAAPPATSWDANWIRADRTFDHAALDKAPDAIKEHAESLKKFTKFDDLLQSYGHQRRILGTKGLLPLREGATDAEKTAHRAQVRSLTGVPDTPAAYGIKAPDDYPEGIEWDQQWADSMAKTMHDLDFSPAQAKGIFDAYNARMKEVIGLAMGAEAEAAQKKLQSDNALLDKEWGINRPQMEQLAQRGALTGGLQPTDELYKDPRVRILCARFARMVSEDKLVADPSGRPAAQTFQQQYDSLTKDEANPLYKALWDSNHPRHREAVDKRNVLAEQLGRELAAQRSQGAVVR